MYSQASSEHTVSQLQGCLHIAVTQFSAISPLVLICVCTKIFDEFGAKSRLSENVQPCTPPCSKRKVTTGIKLYCINSLKIYIFKVILRKIERRNTESTFSDLERIIPSCCKSYNYFCVSWTSGESVFGCRLLKNSSMPC